MATVETVGGRIDVDELGLTLIHEHFFSSDEAITVQWPHIRDHEREFELALETAAAVRSHGVRTVVEPTAMLLGRDAATSQRLATESGLQIVLCTGIYTYDHLPEFLLNRSEDFIADLFVHDIEEGMQGTDVRAAFIKCAADEPGVNERIENDTARPRGRHCAPARRHAHSRPASGTGPRQAEILIEEGVAPEKIHIADTGDTDVPRLHPAAARPRRVHRDGPLRDRSLFAAPPSATRPCSSSCAAATSSGCSSPRTSTSRSRHGLTGTRRR